MDTNSPTAPRRLGAAERRREAVRMRITGATFSSIGEALGVSVQAAHQLVVRALEDINDTTAETAAQLRRLELERLDAMQSALWDRAMNGEEQIVDRLLRIQQRRAALMGLDAPAKVAPTDPTGTREYAALTDEERTERLAALLERARARRAGPPASDAPAGE